MSEHEHTQENTIEQKSNENITVLFKTKPGCIVKMEVRVNPTASKAAYLKAMKDLKKEISLPGFRKGKIPEDIVKKNFQNELTQHGKKILMETAFKEAIRLIERNPFTIRSVRKSEFKHEGKDGSTILLFEYEAMPQVPDVDISACTKDVAHNEPTVREPTQEEIQASIQQLKLLHAVKTDILDRAAKAGDYVTFTIVDRENATPKEQTEHLVKGSIPDTLFDTLEGMTLSETKQYLPNIENKDDMQQPRHITLSKIQTWDLPEEDDAFAQKAGASSIADLINKIGQQKKLQLLNEIKKSLRADFKNELIARYAFDLPQSLIESETESRFRAYMDTLDSDSATKLNQEETRREFQEEVNRYFTCMFLMERLANTLNPSCTQRDYMDEMMYQMFLAPYNEKYLYPSLTQEELQQRILMNIMLNKCCDMCNSKETPPLIQNE